MDTFFFAGNGFVDPWFELCSNDVLLKIDGMETLLFIGPVCISSLKVSSIIAIACGTASTSFCLASDCAQRASTLL